MYINRFVNVYLTAQYDLLGAKLSAIDRTKVYWFFNSIKRFEVYDSTQLYIFHLEYCVS